MSTSKQFRTLEIEDELVSINTVKTIDGRREIGNLATWSLSSAKSGFGVDQLRDNNLDTYWQSDGPAPHQVNIQFPKKVWVDEVRIYTDRKVDESYTPCKISIRAGSHFNDLEEINVWEIKEPMGWLSFSLSTNNLNNNNLSTSSSTKNNNHSSQEKNSIHTNFLQIVILANHQSGRDSHIRQVQVFGPKHSIIQNIGIPEFSTESCFMYSILR
eukprot:TRINITY_DN7732_c4_g1_i1.p1 TRINITY_DN7732_c4_g1~~TRINITY_DN7732_c4_g1_i1.p1  ORF type:complete len:214 (-),score=52.44 TRINITY_DN7732_c4_g1_i1:63-704(-)